MKDKKLIITGMIIFFIIVTFPFWYNRGKAAPQPDLILTAKAKAAKVCVRSTEYMKSEHMQLLDVWRDSVVRRGERIYVSPAGEEYAMSLTNTCLDCHSNKADFCDRCHNYASVRPYCWDCHIDNPKENS
jgi:[DsrC]-trisulfide reductase subunit J